MERIIQKCHEFLTRDINIANCIRILEFGREQKHASLVDMALNFVSRNFVEVRFHAGYVVSVVTMPYLNI